MIVGNLGCYSSVRLTAKPAVRSVVMPRLRFAHQEGRPPKIPKKSLLSRLLIGLGWMSPHRDELKRFHEGVKGQPSYQAACEEFVKNHDIPITYRVPDATGKRLKLSTDAKRFEQGERQILEEIFGLLHARPDLLKKVPEHLHLQLFDAPVFYRKNDPKKIPRAGEIFWNKRDEKVTLRVSLPGAVQDMTNPYDGYDIIAHELAHVLDLIDEHGNLTPSGVDGHLPGWSKEEKRVFNAQREKEWPTIGHPHSLFRAYAGTNNLEFLAVLIETYYERPDDLNLRNPQLFQMMDDFFNLYAPKQ